VGSNVVRDVQGHLHESTLASPVRGVKQVLQDSVLLCVAIGGHGGEVPRRLRLRANYPPVIRLLERSRIGALL
jgi:hypothetical protein